MVYKAIQVFSFISLLGLAACTTETPIELEDSLSTKIFNNGVKQFVYEVKLEGEGAGWGLAHQGNGKKLSKMKRKLTENLYTGLDLRLQESGYCREGYYILEEDILFQSMATLKGECKEIATDQDKEQFSSSQ